ncbi:MAG TPA: DUF6351 family protein [Solirubrobacteraceae bacterium]|nr:DUF6351 family protein [Solirubrobacteraceae bacterium]
MARGILAMVCALGALVTLVPSASAAGDTEIRVLSNRADIVSGGDALVQVVPPTGVEASALRIDVDGRDVTSSFAVRPDGRFLALLTGLKDGANVVTARAPDARGARLTIRNHPSGGPAIAGPQIQPWTCFEGALDAQCNRAPTYEFLYKSTDGGGLQEYDPEDPPDDVATTETDQGRRVPFIVRQETGALDRDEYRIAVLYDPSKPWEPWSPQEGFNHKMVIFHGASCDTSYEQASAPDVLNETALGRGFVTMSHALDNAGHNCNIVTQAESLIMTKERVVEQYGELRYTIGSGCSGGSLVQQQVANAYPGLYQGLTPACSFTDAWSSAMQYVNYLLLRNYYENPTRWRPGVTWNTDKRSSVEGHPNPGNSVTFTEVIPSSGEPTRSCPGVPDEQVYDEDTNPKGVRCTFQDYMVNVFGRRPQDGFAGRPVGNVGFQYGLRALLAQKITATEFLDLNAKIGSYDIDYNFVEERMDADRPALERAYRSGAVNTAENLDQVAIIDLRGPDPGAFHDVYRTYVMRARLEREHGTAANQILWRGQVPLFGDVNYVDEAIVAMDGWLAAVEKDDRDVPLARKIIEDKPESLTERCTDGSANDRPAAVCDATVQSYSDPQIEGGMPFTDDTLRCTLKPLRRTDYGPVLFSDEQWAEMEKLFPHGVCDFTKPGEARVRTNVWQTYQEHDGTVIYGGRPLGARPVSEPFGPLVLPTQRRCASRRSFMIRLPRGVRRARVTYAGRKAKVVRGRRLRARIDLRGLPKGRVVVRVVGRTRSGRVVRQKRVYRPCATVKRTGRARW